MKLRLMSRNLVYVGIAALALIAIVLGYKIYQQQSNLTPLTAIPSSSPSNTAPNQSASQSSQINSSILESTTSAEEERLVKSAPLPTASIEQRIAFNNELARYERSTGIIIISKCKPTPMILRIREETQFDIQNNDSVQYQISIGGEKLTLPPNGKATMRAPKADALTDISCNGGIVGLLHAVE